MNIRDVMTKDVKVVGRDTTLQEIAQQMRSLDVGALPVCDGERLVGMVTDRDITVQAVAAGRDPKSTRASDVMSGDVRWCFEDDDVDAAAEAMRVAEVRRLPVVDRDKRLVGIVALADLVRADGANGQRAVEGVSRAR